MNTQHLPKGVYYESDRDRYRVRLYRRHRVIWHTKHDTLEEALEAYQEAKSRQRFIRVQDRSMDNTVRGRLAALMNNTI